MRKIGKFLLAVMMAAVLAVHSAGAEDMIRINEDLAPMSAEEIRQMVEEATADYYQDPAVEEELSRELSWKEIDNGIGGTVDVYTLEHGGSAMRFLMEQKGEPDENGLYPLYITLHGGGDWTPEDNDGQWFGMFQYYKEAVQNGIYVACRGITDTWDLHFRPESYPLYDRLIQAMIHLYGADPNRVYLLGFSAGGDGVYQITPRMADRFAAANMSSGHPNGVSLRNLMNCPFSIQVGVRDYYSESALRCIRGAEFDQVLNDYRDQMGGGYEHQVLVRVPAGHNYDDITDISLLEEEYEDYMDWFRRMRLGVLITSAVRDHEDSPYDLRYIGFVTPDAEHPEHHVELYEVLDACSTRVRQIRLQMQKKFAEALDLFYKQDFYFARNSFTEILREMPEDEITKWYLFECERYLNEADGSNFVGALHME